MHQQHHPLTTNSHIRKSSEKGKYEWFGHDLMTYIDDLKYNILLKIRIRIRINKLRYYTSSVLW